MATLVSPGVSVTVVDESQYVSATQGTLPLIVVATASNKLDGSGTSIAPGTRPENAGVAYLVSSQRELVETFGVPKFFEVGGSVVQGSELNEYGLLAAYQYLGVSSNAYILRAGIDLAELAPRTEAPAGALADGTYWHSVDTSDFGLFMWDGSAWAKQDPIILDDEPGTGNVEPVVDGLAAPRNFFGQAGDIAIVTSSEKVGYYEKVGTNWILLGDIGSAADFQFSQFDPTTRADGASALVSGDVYVRLAVQGGGLDIDVKYYDSSLGYFSTVQVPVYASDDAASADLIDMNDIYARYDDTLAFFEIRRHIGVQETVLTTNPVPNIGNITAQVAIEGVSFTFAGLDLDTVISQLQASAPLNTQNVKVEKVGSNRIRFTKTNGMELNIDFTSGNLSMGFAQSINSASAWESLAYEASASEPTGEIAEGTLWFNADLKVEILRNEFNGVNQDWAPYAWSEDTIGVSTAELQLRSSMPQTRKDGVSTLVVGDIWVDADSKPYPDVYRWSGTAWTKLDNADQSSVNGLIFSNYSDMAPYDADGNLNTRDVHTNVANPELLPENILMINMDYTTYNVKEYIDGKWVWVSGVNLDGSGRFGNDAVRAMVVEAMQAAVAGNEGIRAESVYFNLIATPGYPELMDEMIALNKDKKEIAFVIGDAPLTLTSDSTSMRDWAIENLPGETYAAVYYPHGLSTDLAGNDVVIPASAIALRTIAFSDQVSFPWFAPAGLTRGVVTNASQVGYVNDENEFVRVRLSEGQRDVLYTSRMNPIADLPNQGLVVYGQKTTQGFASALDRVNVARLVNYMRWNLDQLSRAFLFEQNDRITRDNIRDAIERFCGNLVSQRALYDFLVVCDESNNTPARVDRNELWVDVALQPVKSVEMIYIPLRIRNTGEDLS